MKAPDLIRSRAVPAEVQLYGETFCREKNLDLWFGKLSRENEKLRAFVAKVAKVQDSTGREASDLLAELDDPPQDAQQPPASSPCPEPIQSDDRPAAGCWDPDSCWRNGRCMYTNCLHPDWRRPSNTRDRT